MLYSGHSFAGQPAPLLRRYTMYMNKAIRHDVSNLTLRVKVATRNAERATTEQERDDWRHTADVAGWTIDILLGLDSDGHARKMLNLYAGMDSEPAIKHIEWYL